MFTSVLLAASLVLGQSDHTKIEPATLAGRDRIVLSKGRCTLNLKLHCSVHLDQIRVLVETE